MTFVLKGDRELGRALEALATDASVRRVLRPSVRAALSPVNKAAKRNAKNLPGLKDSHSTGILSKSIAIRKVFVKPGLVSQTVGARSEGFQVPDPVVPGRMRIPKFYALLVEKGTRTMPARPFLGPALEKNRAVVFSTLTGRIRTELAKEVARQARKAGSLK